MKKDEKARVRVFFGEIEGDNETIRDGLRSIAQAVNRTFQPEHRIVKVISSRVNGDAEMTNEELEQIIDAEISEPGTSIGDADFAQNKPKSKSSGRARKPPSYSFVKDLNLRPVDKESLLDFYRKKSPDGQKQELVVVLYYLHRILETPNITADHVYTGIKELKEFGVRVPSDIAQGFRNLANRDGWVDSSDSSNLRMTNLGDNFVEHDLPKKG